MINQAMPQMREFAHRLLACEAASGKASETKAQAVFRVCEKLRQPLCTLAGVEGFRSLLARALTLAKAEVPSLAAVEINADGSLAGWDSVEAQQHLHEPEVCAECLLAQLLGLLITFIGQPLTVRLVVDIWPETLCGDIGSEMEERS
jgi:hypothetical protein